MPTAPNEVYHQLYSHKHGIPQFTPEPNENLPAAYQRVGTSIGDVGVWRNGSFEVLFNACQPANDGINSHFPVPHEFQPFLLNQSAISRRMYHSPGAIIATARTYTVALDVGGSSVVPPILPTSAGSTVTLSFTSKVGAALVLPRGAWREDLLPVRRFREHVRRGAEDWYALAEAAGYLSASAGTGATPSERSIDEDALFVVTGCDKTSAWAITTASSASTSVGFLLKIGLAGLAEGTLEPRFEWSHRASATIRMSRSDIETDNQCVFVRGFFIRRKGHSGRWRRLLQRLALGMDWVHDDRAISRTRRLAWPALYP